MPDLEKLDAKAIGSQAGWVRTLSEEIYWARKGLEEIALTGRQLLPAEVDFVVKCLRMLESLSDEDLEKLRVYPSFSAPISIRTAYWGDRCCLCHKLIRLTAPFKTNYKGMSAHTSCADSKRRG